MCWEVSDARIDRDQGPQLSPRVHWLGMLLHRQDTKESLNVPWQRHKLDDDKYLVTGRVLVREIYVQGIYLFAK